MDEYDDNIVILNDGDGNEMKFELLDLVEYGGNEYIVLLPADDEEYGEEVVILKVEPSDNEEDESYVSVESEEILNAVFEIFKAKLKNEFNFLDE